MRIYLDFGHGGVDCGASAIDGKTKEKQINLTVGLKLAELLIHNGHEVKMCREIDIDKSLNVRVDEANEWGAELYISVHHNAWNGTTEGYQVYHSIYLGKGKVLANYVADEFKTLGQNYNFIGYRESGTTIGKDFYYVIRWTNMPAIITEYAFLDSVDYNDIDTVQEQINEAYAIAKAVCKYTGTVFKDPAIRVEAEHWADKYFNALNANGANVEEKRYDDKITRAEAMALICKALKLV